MRKNLIAVLGVSVTYALAVYSCQPNVSIETAQYAVNGQKLYGVHCQNCHGAKGEGLGMLYPPLTDTAYLATNRAALACIVKNGLEGPVIVDGKTYEGAMPGIPQLSAVEIAYILTYVTTRFGNSTNTYSQDEVKEALEQCQ
ncbi:cbb3-type cytochrome c oxidase subunit III [Sphingobacterium allocomposti]|jgi:mono/diheme cytochrome c family protein|uniref:Cbb3-type cytochrome c oxidase subunit III n=1 Tax=Sphingobacterium allocomposti TaxID=415956 RepID=A0A5S5DQ26_9SPHI|nr:cytochrome c [Sphingobacterium composti Yoo et al. 2007 non Ten et al. 2007]TYP97784.1 cbb3-type cytochrome c oxidase subunit III [Sphingobacterium composti Yoo et al. 2007 non Ten et al. 2007]HLS96348.1 cytochrome c [Sphingobacterium sp.]